MNIEKKAGVVAVLILTLACLGASPAAAQIPTEFKNLKVLPKDIAQRDLIDQMRGFAMGLGVRCHHCHVGEPGASLEGYDFASDEKQAKKTARVMLQMVGEINGKLLPQMGKEQAELIQVNCATCHHGQARPQTLEAVLTETFKKDGLEAATAKYRELREKYYGSYTFDFSEYRLLTVAEQLGGAGHLDAAHGVLELNREFYPESGMTHLGLGQYHQQKGDKEQAIRHYKKAAELSPEMAPRLNMMIEQLWQE